MKKIRRGVFETNSSSTHSLIVMPQESVHYLSPSRTLVVRFIDTDDEHVLSTLKDKVSYLVSQIISKYKYDVYDYDDLKEQVYSDYDFKRIAEYVKNRYNKIVTLPKTHTGSLDEIVNINWQIREDNLDDILTDLVQQHDLLEDVLSQDRAIEIGRD